MHGIRLLGLYSPCSRIRHLRPWHPARGATSYDVNGAGQGEREGASIAAHSVAEAGCSKLDEILIAFRGRHVNFVDFVLAAFGPACQSGGSPLEGSSDAGGHLTSCRTLQSVRPSWFSGSASLPCRLILFARECGVGAEGTYPLARNAFGRGRLERCPALQTQALLAGQ